MSRINKSIFLRNRSNLTASEQESLEINEMLQRCESLMVDMGETPGKAKFYNSTPGHMIEGINKATYQKDHEKEKSIKLIIAAGVGAIVLVLVLLATPNTEQFEAIKIFDAIGLAIIISKLGAMGIEGFSHAGEIRAYIEAATACILKYYPDFADRLPKKPDKEKVKKLV